MIKRISLLFLFAFLLSAISNQFFVNTQENNQDNILTTKAITFSKPKATYSVDVDLSTIDVTVFDDNGKHLTNLNPSDFELYVDGEKQQIAAVDYVNHLKEKIKPETKEEYKPLGNLKISLAKKEPRYFIFMVANLSINPGRKNLVVDKIEQFIENNTGQDDFFSLYNLSSDGIKPIIDLTNDKNVLVDALKKYREEGTYLTNKFPDLTDKYETQVDNIKAPSDDKVIEPYIKTDLSENYRAEHNMFFIKTFQFLGQFIENFQAVPGKKQFILITRGLYHWGYQSLDPEDRGHPIVSNSIMDIIRKLQQDLNASQTSLQLLDVDNEIYSHDINNARISPLLSTAGVSGGEYYKRAARTPEVFEKALEDINYRTSFYYYLSFYPKKKYTPGSSVPVKVVVKRDNAKIIYRNTLGIPKTYNLMTPEEKERHLNQTAFTGYDYNDLSITADIRSFPSNLMMKSLSLFSLQVPSNEVVHLLDNEPIAKLNMSWLIYTESHNLVKTLSKNIDLNLKREYEKRKIDYLRYYEFVILPPGKYNIRFYVRDSLSGKIGTITEDVELTEFKPGEPALGSILPLGKNEDVVGISEYVPLPGRNDVKMNPDNPLYYNNDILVHTLQYKETNSQKINLFLNTRSIEVNQNGQPNIKWYLLGEDRQTKDVMISKMIEMVPHLNSTSGMLFQLNTAGIINGNYILQAEYRSSEGKIYRSECPISIRR